MEGRKVAPKDRVIFPLDGVSPAGAAMLVEELKDYVGYFKIGLGLSSIMGTPQAVQMVHSRGGKAFVDLKINDISNTVANSVKALSAQGVAMLNIHASAEIDAMLEVAKYKGNSLAYAVTVITSLDEEEAYLSFGMPVKAKVLQFARFAALAGMDGIICSAEELAMLAKHHELDKLLRIIPGMRPEWAAPDDQSRYMTPTAAIKAGGPNIKMVIGRPISKPPKGIGSRVEAAERILNEIASALEACA